MNPDLELSPATALQPAGAARAAYVHVPFCAHRCGYCNFTLVAGRDDLTGDYLKAIELELQQLQQPREVDTLFFGGGTPTHLSLSAMRQLLELTRYWFPLTSQLATREFSVEANPADLSAEMVALLAEFGVTRISLGAQSFDAHKLKLLERDHAAADIARSLQVARQQAMTVGLDLIFAAPGETLAGWRDDLDRALELQPDHVSTYGLTFERGTSFWSRLTKGELARLDESIEAQMYAAAIDTLTAAGLEHYEVSNFARPGHRCRHNETYWLGGSYYAVGPGAARYIAGRRESNHRSTTNYIRRMLAGQSPVAESEQLAPQDRARELLVFGLRRLQGVDRQWFAATSGFSLDQIGGDVLRQYVDQQLLTDDGQTVRLTRRGLFISDAMWPKLL